MFFKEKTENINKYKLIEDRSSNIKNPIDKLIQYEPKKSNLGKIDDIEKETQNSSPHMSKKNAFHQPLNSPNKTDKKFLNKLNDSISISTSINLSTLFISMDLRIF